MSLAPEEAHKLAVVGLGDLIRQLEFDAALAARIGACFNIAGHPALKIAAMKIQIQIKSAQEAAAELAEHFEVEEIDEGSRQRDGHLFPGDAVEAPGGGVGPEVQPG